jgi:hypothetical protein
MLVTLVLFASAASAAPPAYKWTNGETVRYYLDTEIYWARSIAAAARRNVDTRIRDLHLRAEAECKVALMGKSAELECTFSWLTLTADSDGDQAKLVSEVMADWTAFAAPARVVLTLAPDGKLREFDVNKLPDTNKREQDLSEQMRAFLHAAFAPLDVNLTTDDKDWVRGWSRKDVGAHLQLPVADSTAGAGTVTLKHADDRLGLTHISLEGRGTVAPGGAVEQSANGGLVDLRVGGEAWVDPAVGQLVFSGFSTDGRFVASATETGAGAYVSQRSGLQRVAAFDPEHKEPLSVVAQRAPKLDGVAPALPAGVSLVEFASLGMQPLFIQGQPEIALPYELPKSSVTARVVVDTDGHASSVTTYVGYEALAEHVQRALTSAKFPAKSAAYAVDVPVEVRP